MAEPRDAILPVLNRIQDEIAAVRKEQQAAKERLIAITDVVLTTQDEVAEIRKDNLRHLGLTTRHHLEFEDLLEEEKDLKARVAALEGRS